MPITQITPSTKLAPGVPISVFLTGSGVKSTFNNIASETEKKQIARNLQIHAYILNTVNQTNYGPFADYTLDVVQGYYAPGPAETPTPGSINDLATKGRAVVYELISNVTGKVDLQKTFDLAVYWKDNIQYDKLILDYDTYNPDGSLSVQIVILTPEITAAYTALFTRQIETLFNNQIQSSSDLLELTI
jgi:hypothetical protein